MRLYHFLGSIYFAIFLITASALFVVVGTLIEAKTESHDFAARYTYNNPIFIALLWGFFINILLSALRRWPFKVRHIPFLTTHCGLLMLLGGALVKSYFGVQGNMSIIEGAASQHIFQPDTLVVQVQKRDPETLSRSITKYYPLEQLMKKRIVSDAFPELQIKLMDYVPHSMEVLESWIKQGHVMIAGIKPFPVIDDNMQELPVGAQIKIHRDGRELWDFYGVQAEDISKAAQKVYLQGMELNIRNIDDDTIFYQGPLAHALENQLAQLSFHFSSVTGFEQPSLLVTLENEKIEVPLTGPKSLWNINQTPPYAGKSPYEITLKRNPAIAFIQDRQGDIFLFAFDPHGRVHEQAFRKDNFNSYIAYDEGYGGYGIQAEIPFYSTPSSYKEVEQKSLGHLAAVLRESGVTKGELSPPLQILEKACSDAGYDFVDTCMAFLIEWNKVNRWLYPIEKPLPSRLHEVFSKLSWEQVPEVEQNASRWVSLLFKDLEPKLTQNNDLIALLKQQHWPFVAPLEAMRNDPKSQQLALTQQVFYFAKQMPKPPTVDHTPNTNAHLLSAYLRAYGIHLSDILIPHEEKGERPLLFGRLSPNRKVLSPLTKLEDNLPGITILMDNGTKKETIALTYDRYGTGLRWPILMGEYLVRFQPMYKDLPYRIRLRNARQINYAGSSQPYSYESDLIVTNNQGNVVETTISMNHVYETWDGYRFYLANMTPPGETSIKRVQIIVNYDPAKYYLTYPGALIMSLGILLLFWMWPYGKKTQ